MSKSYLFDCNTSTHCINLQALPGHTDKHAYKPGKVLGMLRVRPRLSLADISFRRLYAMSMCYGFVLRQIHPMTLVTVSKEARRGCFQVMEQQTITINKAAFSTHLNARCSVLAAANPVYGSYDDSMTAHRNIGMQDSLLSRFDCLFMVRDNATKQADKRVCINSLYPCFDWFSYQIGSNVNSSMAKRSKLRSSTIAKVCSCLQCTLLLKSGHAA